MPSPARDLRSGKSSALWYVRLSCPHEPHTTLPARVPPEDVVHERRLLRPGIRAPSRRPPELFLERPTCMPSSNADVFVRVLPAGRGRSASRCFRSSSSARRSAPDPRLRRERPPQHVRWYSHVTQNRRFRSRRTAAGVGRVLARIGEVRGERARVVEALQRGRGDARVAGAESSPAGGRHFRGGERRSSRSPRPSSSWTARRRGRRTSEPRRPRPPPPPPSRLGLGDTRAQQVRTLARSRAHAPREERPAATDSRSSTSGSSSAATGAAASPSARPRPVAHRSAFSVRRARQAQVRGVAGEDYERARREDASAATRITRARVTATACADRVSAPSGRPGGPSREAEARRSLRCRVDARDDDPEGGDGSRRVESERRHTTKPPRRRPRDARAHAATPRRRASVSTASPSAPADLAGSRRRAKSGTTRVDRRPESGALEMTRCEKAFSKKKSSFKNARLRARDFV